MPARVTINLKDIKKMVDNVSKKFSLDLKAEIADVIAEKITSGISPVDGQGRYKNYSESYSTTKGRVAPVDMIVTGNMLNSLTVKQSAIGRIKIFFNSKIADYHQKGSNKLPKRELLPNRRGSTFTLDIIKKIKTILEKAVRKEVTRQNS